jgi:phage tail protein X
MRVAVMVANLGVGGHLCNRNYAAMGLFAADVLELDGGVADVEVLFEHVIEIDQDAVAL